NPAISPELDTVILHALAKRPADRFPSISAFANAFQQALTIVAPPTASTQIKTPEEDIQATLAISPEEAIYGTSRTLTLTGGRRIKVDIPAGMQHGQVIRTPGKDPTSSDGSAI